jgi:hypothetical protein
MSVVKTLGGFENTFFLKSTNVNIVGDKTFLESLADGITVSRHA